MASSCIRHLAVNPGSGFLLPLMSWEQALCQKSISLVDSRFIPTLCVIYDRTPCLRRRKAGLAYKVCRLWYLATDQSLENPGKPLPEPGLNLPSAANSLQLSFIHQERARFGFHLGFKIRTMRALSFIQSLIAP
jgi:hypothetical protein